MTLHHPAQMFAIIPVTNGRVPDEALVTGNINQVMEYIPQSGAREHAVARLEQLHARADACVKRAEEAGDLEKLVLQLKEQNASQQDQIRTLKEELTEYRRADAERTARKEERRKRRHEDNALDVPPGEHHPPGDLHDLPAKEADASAGADALHDADPEDLDHQVPQPTSISLNKE